MIRSVPPSLQYLPMFLIILSWTESDNSVIQVTHKQITIVVRVGVPRVLGTLGNETKIYYTSLNS